MRHLKERCGIRILSTSFLTIESRLFWVAFFFVETVMHYAYIQIIFSSRLFTIIFSTDAIRIAFRDNRYSEFI